MVERGPHKMNIHLYRTVFSKSTLRTTAGSNPVCVTIFQVALLVEDYAKADDRFLREFGCLMLQQVVAIGPDVVRLA
jgi:hypothetical protein